MKNTKKLDLKKSINKLRNYIHLNEGKLSFIEISESFFINGIVNKILGESKKELTPDAKKILLARCILSEKKFNFLGEEWVLIIGTVELKLINEFLNQEQIKIIGGKYLSSPYMTPEKIVMIGLFLNNKLTEEFGGKMLASAGITPELIRKKGERQNI